MHKEKMLYISPFWPVKSGISEYSETLIWGLEKYYEITILTDDYDVENKEIKKNFKFLRKSELVNVNDYSVLLYNFGNNPDGHGYMYDLFLKNPGYVILHDFSLYYLAVGQYHKTDCLYQRIYEMQGVEGIQLLKDSLKKNPESNLLLHKDLAAVLPMNKEIIDSAKGIIVHSQYTADEIRKINDKVNIHKIHLVYCGTQKKNYKSNYLRKLFNIKETELIIGAVGFIGPSKQNHISCMAVKEYNNTHKEKIHYVMIGEGNYVDELLDDYIHKTSFLKNDDFFDAISSCDLILNLRYPYNGESSATLIQCMAMGKTCVVTDIGCFSEVPDNCVIKVPFTINVHDLIKVIDQTKSDNTKYGKHAKEYVREYCSAEKIAMEINYYLHLNCSISNNSEI